MMEFAEKKDGNVNENWVKSEWFKKINPNGRVPALTTHEGYAVFESSAILEYLAELYDKDRKLSFSPVDNPKEWSQQQSWKYFTVSCNFFLSSETDDRTFLSLQHGGLGPMSGQIGFFILLATEKV